MVLANLLAGRPESALAVFAAVLSHLTRAGFVAVAALMAVVTNVLSRASGNKSSRFELGVVRNVLDPTTHIERG